MSQPPTNPPILVGRRVRIVRRVPGIGVPHEGAIGRITLVTKNPGLDYLVELSIGRSVWVPRDNLVMVLEDADHLDAVEAGVLAAHRARRTYDTEPRRPLTDEVRGSIRATVRAALVPKGGA